MSPDVFKSYDIRGLAPQELDSAFARRLGKVLATIYKPGHVVIGRDMRSTSETLELALVEGLTASGVHVTRVGLCTTPMFQTAMEEGRATYGLGVMVTASHNPPEYNGFKLIGADLLPIGLGSGLEVIRNHMLSDLPLSDSPTIGEESADTGLLDRYLERVLTILPPPAKLPNWRVAIDTGNGMAGLVMPKFCKRLPGMEFIQLFWDLNGTFPNHEANPVKEETLAALKQSVLHDGCAFGVAFDGDADRVAFVDDQGVKIPGDILIALFARELLRSKGSGSVVFDVRSSWTVDEVIVESGGTPVMHAAGSTQMKRTLQTIKGLWGGEASGHLFFPELNYGESGELAVLLMIQILLRAQQPLSEIWKPLQRYSHPPEINFTVADPKRTIESLHAIYASSATTLLTIDGIRCEFRDVDLPENDWWFNLRASNTEPLIRLNLEARTPEKAAERIEEITANIQATTQAKELA